MIDIAFARRLPQIADKFGATLDADLRRWIEHVTDLTRFPLPRPSVSEVAQAMADKHLCDPDALTKAFAKGLRDVAAAGVADDLHRSVRQAAAAAVLNQVREQRDEVLAAFIRSSVATSAVATLNEHAARVPATISSDAVLSAPADVVAAYKATLDAWNTLREVVRAIGPLYGSPYSGAADENAYYGEALALVEIPQFEDSEQLLRFIDAAKGEAALPAHTMASGSHRTIFRPAGLAGLGATFSLADATMYAERVSAMKDARSAGHWTVESQGRSPRRVNAVINAATGRVTVLG